MSPTLSKKPPLYFDSEEELDPEIEALLYSKIHHDETSLLEEKEIEIIEERLATVNKAEEESRFDRLTEPSSLSRVQPNDESSSDEDDGDNGIVLAGKIVHKDEKSMYKTPVKNPEIKVENSVQKKNVLKYIYSREETSDEDEVHLDESNLDLSLNISAEEGGETRTMTEIIGWKEKVAVSPSDGGHWTEDMRDFYDEADEGLADITMEKILESMPDDPELWKVDLEDRIPSFSRRNDRYFFKEDDKLKRIRCLNCNEYGHMARKCSAPKKIMRCSMCGLPGHRETRCDASMCLRCRNPSQIYTSGCYHCRRLNSVQCNSCSGFGHFKKECPEIWRRHRGQRLRFRPPSEMWCPNCAKRGHYLHQCRAYSYSAYPPSIIGDVESSTVVTPVSASKRKKEKSKFKKKMGKTDIRANPSEKDRKNSHVNIDAIRRPHGSERRFINPEALAEKRKKKKLKKMAKKAKKAAARSSGLNISKMTVEQGIKMLKKSENSSNFRAKKKLKQKLRKNPFAQAKS